MESDLTQTRFRGSADNIIIILKFPIPKGMGIMLLILHFKSCRFCGFRILMLGDVVAQRQQTVGKMHVLNYGLAVRGGDIHIGEVPDRFNAVGGEPFGNRNGGILRDCQHRYISPIFIEVGFKLIHVHYRDTVEALADYFGVDVEGTGEPDAP